MNEPKDGDFVAYLEALQRESAARLGQHPSAHAPLADATDDSFGRSAKPDQRADLEAIVQRFLRHDGDALLVRPLVAAVVGIVTMLVWLGNGGLFWLLVGLGALIYGIPRLSRALRAFNAPRSNRAAIDQVFSKPVSKK
jgi:hypothetical protein